jgi:hypothetical protein
MKTLSAEAQKLIQKPGMIEAVRELVREGGNKNHTNVNTETGQYKVMLSRVTK